MSVIIALIVGGIVGWLAAAVTGRNEGVLGSVAIGIVGSILGGLLANLFSSGNQGYFTASWMGLFWAFIGAVLLSVILNAMQHRMHNV